MPPEYLEADADLHEEHAKVCQCSQCRPELHAPIAETLVIIDRDGAYLVRKGWLFE